MIKCRFAVPIIHALRVDEPELFEGKTYLVKIAEMPFLPEIGMLIYFNVRQLTQAVTMRVVGERVWLHYDQMLSVTCGELRVATFLKPEYFKEDGWSII